MLILQHEAKRLAGYLFVFTSVSQVSQDFTGYVELSALVAAGELTAPRLADAAEARLERLPDIFISFLLLLENVIEPKLNSRVR
jgi:hypothetical protein